jgi:hypothetical protein
MDTELQPEPGLPDDMYVLDNWPGDAHCPYCCNDGQVCVGTARWVGADFEQMGPCPRCQRGYRVEFGIGVDKHGNDVQAKRPAWGKDGYWRGQPEWSAIPKTCRHDQPPLTGEEAKLYAKVAMKELNLPSM